MNLSPQWLDQLRGRLTLSSLIGRSIKVEKAGREYKACCPFHSENTPSFTINDQKGFYHCFGCGAHGDAIRWMTDHRGLGFMDAVKELASEAGMDVPAPDPQSAKRAEKRGSLYDVCAAAQDWFATQLNSLAGAEARAYLKKRGISAETQAKFGFGFAPDGRGNITKALDGFPIEKLVEAGLLISVDGKQPYDRFRGRLMIPIRDARGRSIAWGGRILGDGQKDIGPKYLNSPDTPLFDKGRTLYNIDNAAAASRQTGRLIVVEGYMDAIALAQAGFEDVVAPLGTALTEEQIAMAWKMADRPILCLDGDNAGQKAAMRAASRALPIIFAGHSLAFATLPQGLDPDDLLRASGPKALEKILVNSASMTEKIWQHELAKADLSTPETKAALKAALLNHVQSINDRDIAGFYRNELMDRFYALMRESRDSKRPGKMTARKMGGNFYSAPNPRSSPFKTAPMMNANQRNLGVVEAVLSGFLRFPEALPQNSEALCELNCQDEDLTTLRNFMLEYLAHDHPLDHDHLIAILRDNGLGAMCRRLMRADGLHFSFSRGKDEEQLIQAQQDLQEVLHIAIAQRRIAASLSKITAKLDNEPSDEAFLEFAELQEQRRKFSKRISDLAERARAR